jgi:hypothetical protein
MANELRRASRYSLTAVAEIVDLTTGTRVSAQTSDLSLLGCYVDTLNPLPSGTQIKISISHEGQTFTGAGLVVYSSAHMGMGIKFLKVPHDHLSMLQEWLRKFDRNKS